MALSYIAVLVTRKCTHAAWRFKIEIVTSNSALISFHQHCSRISCCSLAFSSYSLACHNQHLLSKLPLIPPAFIAVMHGSYMYTPFFLEFLYQTIQDSFRYYNIFLKSLLFNCQGIATQCKTCRELRTI